MARAVHIHVHNHPRATRDVKDIAHRWGQAKEAQSGHWTVEHWILNGGVGAYRPIYVIAHNASEALRKAKAEVG